MKPLYIVRRGDRYLVIDVSIKVTEDAYGNHVMKSYITKTEFTSDRNQATVFGDYPAKHIKYFEAEAEHWMRKEE